jgi:hypothetical protein
MLMWVKSRLKKFWQSYESRSAPMSNDRYSDFRAAMRQKETDLNSTGLKCVPQNNRKDWSHIDNHWYSKKKLQEVAEPQYPQGWLDTL